MRTLYFSFNSNSVKKAATADAFHFLKWLAPECCSTIPGFPSGGKQDSPANSYLGLVLEWELRAGDGEVQGERTGYREKVGDKGCPTFLRPLKRNSEGEFLLEKPDPA